MTSSNPFRVAVTLAQLGLKVFPVSRDKRPRCPKGHLAASSDPHVVAALHEHCGFVLVGVATGEPSGVSVLDIDRKDSARAWWAENRMKLPLTRTHRTRGGGLHLWFIHEPGLRSSVGRIAPGIDVRASRSSCIWWPGADFPVLCEADPAPWPGWLRPLPKPTWTPPAAETWHGSDVKGRRYALAALRHAIERVATAAPGTRNDTLNSETFGLTRLTVSGALAPEEIAEAMAHAALAAGLERLEIEATLRSALSAWRTA